MVENRPRWPLAGRSELAESGAQGSGIPWELDEATQELEEIDDFVVTDWDSLETELQLELEDADDTVALHVYEA
eukprot:tig00021036_g17329.t1